MNIDKSKNLYCMSIIVLLFLFIPVLSNTFLVIFDYTIVHLVFLYALYRLVQTNLQDAILLTVIYMTCVFQRHVALTNTMLNSLADDVNISSTLRYTLALRIINNDTISSREKADFLNRIINSRCKSVYKLNLLLRFMNINIDPLLKEEVLINFLNLHSKNTIVIAKTILEDKSNGKPLLNALAKSNINELHRINILNKMSSMYKGEDIEKEIKTTLIRKATIA